MSLKNTVLISTAFVVLLAAASYAANPDVPVGEFAVEIGGSVPIGTGGNENADGYLADFWFDSLSTGVDDYRSVSFRDDKYYDLDLLVLIPAGDRVTLGLELKSQLMTAERIWQRSYGDTDSRSYNRYRVNLGLRAKFYIGGD